MTEIIDFAKAKALRETQANHPHVASITTKRSANPNTEIGRLLYEMGLEMGESGAKQLGAELLTNSLGMHRAVIAMENMEIKHKLKKNRKNSLRVLDE